MEMSAYVAISEDVIEIDSNAFLEDKKKLNGIGYEFGLGYIPIFNKKHAIPMMLIYHVSKIKNNGGTNLNQNYIGLRFIYSFYGIL